MLPPIPNSASKLVAVMNPATPTPFVQYSSARLIVATGSREIKDAFAEQWFINNAAEPVLYLHAGSTTAAAMFGQYMSHCLQIGGSIEGGYDPLAGIPLNLFFSKLTSRDPGIMGRVSSSYIKSLSSLLLAEHYAPTLYRLNRFANKNLGAILNRHADTMDDDDQAFLLRGMNKSAGVIDSTLDFLDMLCDACGDNLNHGVQSDGQSIYSALAQGRSVSIDLSVLSNPIAANAIFTQLDYTRQRHVPFYVVLDAEMLPDTLCTYLMDMGVSRVNLLLTTDAWAMARTEMFSRSMLASREGMIFIPQRNMQACKDLSTFLDTYWRRQETTATGTNRGNHRRALQIIPAFSNGRTVSVTVSQVKDSVLSAVDLRSLEANDAVIVMNALPAIGIVPLMNC